MQNIVRLYKPLAAIMLLCLLLLTSMSVRGKQSVARQQTVKREIALPGPAVSGVCSPDCSVYLPVIVRPVAGLKEQVSTTIVTLPHALEAEVGSFCTWGGCLISPRLYHEPLMDGRILVGWTDTGGNGHISVISGQAIQNTFDFPAHSIRGLVAHSDNSFAVLLWDPGSDHLWLSKRQENGSEVWTRDLIESNTVAEFWLGDGRLAYGNGLYATYYTVTGSGHYGDQLKYVDDNGNIQPGGWGWGCSHSMAELVSYHPDMDQFIAVCSSDCYASKGILINNSIEIYEADGNCGGNVSAQLGQLALGEGNWKLIFNAMDMPCCDGQGVAMATIDANYQSSYTWLTHTDGASERDPVMARLGHSGQAEQYLVGWTTMNDAVYQLGIVDGNGNFLDGPEEVSSAGIQWGNRDDSFRTHQDGSVSWVQGDANSTTLRVFHFEPQDVSVPRGIWRVSVASDGTEGNNPAHDPDMSADGRYIAFSSEASNLVPGDTNGYNDIFVHDRQTGITERVSIASDGAQANDHVFEGHISGDGRYIAFMSKASNLVPNDTNNTEDVFVHDRQTGTATRVSVASDGTQGNNPSWYPAISADSRYVAFWSWANNLVPGDTNGTNDIFVHDRQTGVTTRVSVASDGTQGNGNCGFPTISADGRYVAFMSESTNLVPNDTNGVPDTFIHDRQTGVTERVSVASNGVQGNADSGEPTLSADGHYMAFKSLASNLVSDDTNNVFDVFVHDQQADTTIRVSVASDGSQGNEGSNFYGGPNISADGRYVVFWSFASNLVPNDTNGAYDVFVHDRQTGITNRVSVASNGAQGNNYSWEPDISADGGYIAFESAADNLVSGDTNGQTDVFVHDSGVP